MGYEHIEVERDGHVVTITMDRPKQRNALSLALMGEPVHPIHRGLLAFARGYAHLRTGARDRRCCACWR